MTKELDLSKYVNERCERCRKIVNVHKNIQVDDAGDMFVIMGKCPLPPHNMGIVHGVEKQKARMSITEVAEPDHFTHETSEPTIERTLEQTPLTIKHEILDQPAFLGDINLDDVRELIKYLPKLRALFNLTK